MKTTWTTKDIQWLTVAVTKCVKMPTETSVKLMDDLTTMNEECSPTNGYAREIETRDSEA